MRRRANPKNEFSKVQMNKHSQTPHSMRPPKLSRSYIDALPLEAVQIIQDSREQRPLDLSPCRVQVGTLQSGDYSSPDGRVLIERKGSLDELISCFSVGRERFAREMERLAAADAAVVLIEASFEELITGRWRSQMKQEAAFSTMCSWLSRYRVGFQFVGNRPNAERFAQQFFLQAQKRRIKELWQLSATLTVQTA